MGVEHFLVDTANGRLLCLGKGSWGVGFPYDAAEWTHVSPREIRLRVQLSWERTKYRLDPEGDASEWYFELGNLIWAFCNAAGWQVEHVNDSDGEFWEQRRDLKLVASRYARDKLVDDPQATAQARYAKLAAETK